MANIVALLESMWGWRGYSSEGDVIRYFRINPDNFSGKRLYRIVGNHNLLVTNSCRECQRSANEHGKPDPDWVADNLKFLASQKMDLLLVCGKVAKETYEASGFQFPRVIFMDHPAARRWTNAALDAVAQKVTSAIQAMAAGESKDLCSKCGAPESEHYDNTQCPLGNGLYSSTEVFA